MRRYALRDDQWDRIKDLLPGREGHVGANGRETVCLSMPCSTVIAPAFPGATCRRGSAIRSRSTLASPAGPARPSGNGYSNISPPMPIMNTP
jgi:transposase